MRGAATQAMSVYIVEERQREHPVLRFVERELRSFLECGILAHDFLRVHCNACGKDRIVPFSVKDSRRGE